MKRCCGSCMKWRKITGRTGQCGEERNSLKEVVLEHASSSAEYVSLDAITTPIDDYCSYHEAKE